MAAFTSEVSGPTLLYHKIDRPAADVKIRGAYTLPRRFAKQIAYLKKTGVKFYTAAGLVDAFIENGRFPENAVCLTFDDGWKDNFENAFPILKQFNVPATIFLVPACVGMTTDRVTAEGEGPREHLSKEDIREMAAWGIDFGSHSMNHKLFDRISPEEIVAEVGESKAYIEDLLQKECRTFAYPAGFFTDIAKTAVKTAGYTAAFSTVYGSNGGHDLFELNRTEILRRDGFPFRFARKVRRLTQPALPR
jgi:peptidoglycan/xylan/chitin deacetylase (PgdA/CDA1 family)